MLVAGGVRTKTLKARVALRLGLPLSAARTVIIFVLGAWDMDGVQVKNPPLELMLAPRGAASRL